MHCCLWFLLLPQAFLGAAWLAEAGGPQLDVGALAAVFLALFARPRALPLLLLGAATGRALVDEAAVPVQMLVLGVPVAVLLPLRAWFHRQLWWQVAASLLLAIAVPRLAGLCGRWFEQPSAASVEWPRVLATALLGPPLLWLLRRLPPLASLQERG